MKYIILALLLLVILFTVFSIGFIAGMVAMTNIDVKMKENNYDGK